MADDPVFDPKNALGSGFGKLTQEELLQLVKRLCEISAAQGDENGFRGGFRPGNIVASEDGVTVGPPDKASEDGWTKDELEYMAPEVFWNGERTARADVYSIGLILYVGLNCGNVPFVPMADYKPTPEARANALRKRMNGGKIPVESIHDAELAKITAKAIDFDVDKRYKNALELLNALRAYSGEEPVAAIKREPMPKFKAAEPEKKAEPQAPKKPEPVKAAPAEPEKKPAPKPEPEQEPAPAVRKRHPVVTKYQVRSRRVRCITLIVIALLLIGVAVAAESDIKIDLSDLKPDPKPVPTATAAPEPSESPEPTTTPEPTATPEPTPTPPSSICEVIVEDISWDKAELKCREMGGHLMTIASEKDYQKACELLAGTDAKYVWIGCYRNNADILTWTSGAECDFYKWADGEPSQVDAYDGAHEDYLMLVRQYDGTWLYNDSRMDPMADYAQYYSGKIAYICQHG